LIIVLAFLENARLGPFSQQIRNLFMRDRRNGPGTDAEEAQYTIRHPAQDTDQSDRLHQIDLAQERIALLP